MDNVWKHDFTVTVNPCDSTFAASASDDGQRRARRCMDRETITGTFSADGTASASSRPAPVASSRLDNETMGDDVDNTTVRHVR